MPAKNPQVWFSNSGVKYLYQKYFAWKIKTSVSAIGERNHNQWLELQKQRDRKWAKNSDCIKKQNFPRSTISLRLHKKLWGVILELLEDDWRKGHKG